MPEEKARCIICKSEINPESKKCLACGSRQDWLRFFDIGNTSLSLLIAAISVFALGADNIVRLAGWFIDKERTSFTVKITSIYPNQISLFIDNDGPGNAVFSGSALCSIWPPASPEVIWTGNIEDTDRYSGVRYPTPEEVTKRLIYFYGSDESEAVVRADQNLLVSLPFRNMIITDEIPTDRAELKSYCTIGFSHENGQDDMVFQIIDAVNVSFFSLSNKDVREAIENYEENLETFSRPE